MIRRRLSWLCAAVLVLASASAHLAAPWVHTVSIEGQLAGEERLVVQADGTLHNDFKYSNNGRGPTSTRTCASRPTATCCATLCRDA